MRKSNARGTLVYTYPCHQPYSTPTTIGPRETSWRVATSGVHGMALIERFSSVTLDTDIHIGRRGRYMYTQLYSVAVREFYTCPSAVCTAVRPYHMRCGRLQLYLYCVLVLVQLYMAQWHKVHTVCTLDGVLGGTKFSTLPTATYPGRYLSVQYVYPCLE